MAPLKPINMGVPIQFWGQQDSVCGSSKEKEEEGKREGGGREKLKGGKEKRNGGKEKKRKEGKRRRKRRKIGKRKRKRKECHTVSRPI